MILEIKMARQKSWVTDYAKMSDNDIFKYSNDRKEYQRKTRIQRKITEKITKQHTKLN